MGTEVLTVSTSARRLWELVHRPIAHALAELDGGPHEFRLGGGTTLAARWQHRESFDLDLFVDRNAQLGELANPSNPFDLTMRALGGTPEYSRRQCTVTFPSGQVDLLQVDPVPPGAEHIAVVNGTPSLVLDTAQILHNALTGPIPVELGRLTNLRELDLASNELTGSVPNWLGNLVRLQWLSLADNELTGRIPAVLGSLANLEHLDLDQNALSGPIPAALGSLANLARLNLDRNALSGPIPAELGSLSNLYLLDLSHNWALSGALPSGLQESSSLEFLDIFVTRACAPAVWRDWLETIDDSYAPLCGAAADVTIDVAVLYTPVAREAAGGRGAIEAEIDLLIAETNEAYEASGVRQRLALVARSEVPYAETFGGFDLRRLNRPSDGHLDEAHALRDETGADVVHLKAPPREKSGQPARPARAASICRAIQIVGLEQRRLR